MTQVAELQRKARAPISEGEFELATQYAKQAQDLGAQTAKAVKDGDATVVTQKQAVKTAIDAMRESEQLAIQALEGEGRAHQKAASEATSARGQIEAALRGTQAQIEEIRAQLETGLKFAIVSTAASSTPHCANSKMRFARRLTWCASTPTSRRPMHNCAISRRN